MPQSPTGRAVFSIVLPVETGGDDPVATAMTIETGAQTRSPLSRHQVQMAPRANNPANTHIPIGPSRERVRIGQPGRFEDEKGGERVDHDTGHCTGDAKPGREVALVLPPQAIRLAGIPRARASWNTAITLSRHAATTAAIVIEALTRL